MLTVNAVYPGFQRTKSTLSAATSAERRSNFHQRNLIEEGKVYLTRSLSNERRNSRWATIAQWNTR
jgi:hypothetical protein